MPETSESPLTAPPDLWSVALDKMRDYYGQPLVSQVTLSAEEAFAFVTHYLETSGRADLLRAALVDLRGSIDHYVSSDLGFEDLAQSMDRAYAALYPEDAAAESTA